MATILDSYVMVSFGMLGPMAMVPTKILLNHFESIGQKFLQCAQPCSPSFNAQLAHHTSAKSDAT